VNQFDHFHSLLMKDENADRHKMNSMYSITPASVFTARGGPTGRRDRELARWRRKKYFFDPNLQWARLVPGNEERAAGPLDSITPFRVPRRSHDNFFSDR